MLKIPAEYDRDTLPEKIMDIPRQVSSCFGADNNYLSCNFPESSGG
jgi:hypothetical protein